MIAKSSEGISLADVKPLRPRASWGLPVGIALVSFAIMIFVVQRARPAYLAISDLTPYLIQAEVFGSGHLDGPAPPEEFADFFKTFGMIQKDGREYSRQPPGASAAMAGLTLITGDIRFASPILSAVALGLTLVWVRRVFDTRTAVLAICMCLVDLKYLFLAPTILSYPTSGLLTTTAMLLFVLSIEKERVWPALLCGLVVGLQFTVRPFTATLVVAWLAISRLALFRASPRTVGQSLAFAGGLVPGIGLLLLHNWAITGAVLPLAFSIYCPNDRLGFGIRGLGDYTINHTLMNGLGNLVKAAGELVQGPPLGYLDLLPVTLWWLGRGLTRGRSRRSEVSRWDLMLVLMIVVFLGGHVLYWSPRQVCYFDCLPALWVLFARGIWYLIGSGRALRAVACAVVLVECWTLRYVPGHLEKTAAVVAAIQDEIDRVHEAEGPLLLFIRPHQKELGFPPVEQKQSDPHASWLVLHLFNNPLNRDHAPIIYARDLGPRNRLLMRHYADHRPKLLRARAAYENGQLKTVEWMLLPPS
ncbi:MAG: glycosyltransferase family 39 protein [Phycisphaerae bacterium]|nr:glycosyltransferase family 39 protein [Phycisphaerae bacterium]